MSAHTPASEVLLRHAAQFEDRHVLFAGDLQDNLPAHLTTASSRVHTQQYHHWQSLSQLMGERAAFSLFATAEQTAGCNTLIYYWPKNKPEAVCQLTNLLSLLHAGCDIFIVGENRSGVRSAEALLNEVVSLNKIDSARRCGLYHGRLERPPAFAPGNYYQEYTSHSLTIKTLPGVFSRDGLDAGSALLLSTLPSHSKGKVLDIGCGAGVIAATLKQRSPKVRLWLCDVNAAALAASKATLEANQLEGEVLASNVFSDISGRFDMIVSNPPFHEGLQTSMQAANALIGGAARHLNTGGELRIVANAFLPYPQALEETFGHYEILAQTGRFRVYRSVWGRNQTR